MATEPDTDPAAEHASEPRAEDISDEIARKYDPERLLKLISRRAGRGEPLEHSVRAKYEQRFGVDLGHVRIFSGEFAEEFNRRRDAYALTVGSTGMIFMGGSPEKSMGSTAGQALLAHELTHVAQAARGNAGAGGLSRSAVGGMPFTQEHEHEAEAVEAHEAGASTRRAAESGSAQVKAKEEREHALEKIRTRVLEMAADAARTQYTRSGVQRRP